MADSGFPDFLIAPREFLARIGGAARGHCGLRNARNDEKAKPVRNDHRFDPSRAKSDLLRPTKAKSNLIKGKSF